MASAWAYRTDGSTEQANLHLPALEAAGLLGISEEAGRATLWFGTRVDRLPLAGRWEAVAAQDWDVAWRQGLGPVRAGAITVAPPWCAPEGGLVVTIDPGQAFGTGHHETTVGCLKAVQAAGPAGKSVLDVGTGSGVLAIAAARLGAHPVVALDVDPQATAAARSNAAANEVTIDVVDGSMDAVAGRRFDIVVANLDTSTVVRLAAELVAATGGSLIISGVSVGRVGEAVAALMEAGAAVHTTLGREWAVLTSR